MSLGNNACQTFSSNENISLELSNSPKPLLAHIPCVASGSHSSSNGPLTPVLNSNQNILSNFQEQSPKVYTPPDFPSPASSSAGGQSSIGPPEIDLKAKLFAAFLKRDVRQSSTKGLKRTHASGSSASSPSSFSSASSSSSPIVKSSTKRKKLAADKDSLTPKAKRGRTKKKTSITPSPSPSPSLETNTFQSNHLLLTTNDTNSTPHPLSISHAPSSDLNPDFSLKLYSASTLELPPDQSPLPQINTHLVIPKFDSTPASPEKSLEFKPNIDTPSLFVFEEDSQKNCDSALCSDCYIHHIPLEAHPDSTNLVAFDEPTKTDAPLSYVQQYILPYVVSSSRASWQCTDCTEEIEGDSLFQNASISRSSISSANSDVPQRILESYMLAEKAESCSSCLSNIETQIDSFSSSITSNNLFVEDEKEEQDLPVFKSMYTSTLFDLETMPKLQQQYSQPSPSPTPSPNDDYNLYHLDIFPCAESYHEKLCINSDDTPDTDYDEKIVQTRAYESTLISTTDCFYSNSSFYLH